MRETLNNILTEFVISMKLVTLIRMCLNETYSSQVGNNLLCYMFRLFWKKQISYHHCFPELGRLQLNRANQVLFINAVYLLGLNNAIKNMETLSFTSKESGLEVITEKTTLKAY
jgi:hypothetical protein